MQCGRVLCVSVVCVGVAWSVGMVVVWSAVLRDSSVFNMMRSGVFFFLPFFWFRLMGINRILMITKCCERQPADEDPPKEVRNRYRLLRVTR